MYVKNIRHHEVKKIKIEWKKNNKKIKIKKR